MYEIERTINIDLPFSFRDVKIYYDADKYNNRDYVADLTLYYNNNWTSEDTKCLKSIMRSCGATNILLVKRKALARTYLDIAFDIKQSKMKELGII